MPKLKPVNENGSLKLRRLSASVPVELAAEIESARRSGESLNQALIRLLELGLHARATLAITSKLNDQIAAAKRSETNVTASAQQVAEDVARIRSALQKLVDFVNSAVQKR
jgi:hypothetical protein